MSGRDLIVIGRSTAGVASPRKVARGLPTGFPAGGAIVRHLPPGWRGVPTKILHRHFRDGTP